LRPRKGLGACSKSGEVTLSRAHVAFASFEALQNFVRAYDQHKFLDARGRPCDCTAEYAGCSRGCLRFGVRGRLGLRTAGTEYFALVELSPFQGVPKADVPDKLLGTYEKGAAPAVHRRRGGADLLRRA